MRGVIHQAMLGRDIMKAAAAAHIHVNISKEVAFQMINALDI